MQAADSGVQSPFPNYDRKQVFDLLVEAGLVDSSQLSNAVETASALSIPAEQVVLDLKLLKSRDIENACQALDAIGARHLSRAAATGLLGLAGSVSLEFERVLVWARSMGDPETLDTSEIESLLLDASVTDSISIREGKKLAVERSTTFARALLLLRCVSFPVLNCAYECLHLVRAGRISYEQAVSALALVRREGVDLAAALSRHGLKPSNTLSRIKIGDLLLAGRVLTESQILEIVEKSIYGKQLMGTILTESGLISEKMLQELLLLQKFCERDVIDRQSAARLVKKALESGRSIAVTARQTGAFRDDVDTTDSAINLIFKAGLASMNMVQKAVAEYQLYGMDPLKGLLADGQISACLSEAAVECVKLERRGAMSEEQSIHILHHCDRNRVDFQTACRDLGFTASEGQKTTTVQIARPKCELHKSAEFILLILVSFTTVLAVVYAGAVRPEPLGALSMPLAALLGMGVMALIAVCWKIRINNAECDRQSKNRDMEQNLSRLSRIQQKANI